MDCGRCGQPAGGGQRYCTQCGETLARSCSHCSSDLDPGDRFCGSCGHPADAAAAPARDDSPRKYTPPHLVDKILRQRSAIEGERKAVTVLFADIKGSMELAAGVDDEVWHEILDRFFALLSAAVHRFDGTVNQYTGDGIMALFGAPIALEDHAQRACYAALAMRDAVRELGRELRRDRGLDFAARFGLNSGTVVVGAIGEDLRMDYTAQGQVVGLAARMEQLAEAGAVYLAEGTAKLVSGYFQLDDLGRFQIKGVGGGVPVHELIAVGDARNRLDLSRARGLSPFVGREREAARLGPDAGPVRCGIVAAAGQGKSRLCLEALAHWREQGAVVLECVGLSHAESLSLMPVVELFRAALGISADDHDDATRDRVAGKLLLLGEGFRGHVDYVLELLGLTSDRRLPGGEVRVERLLEVLARLLTDLGVKRPVVLVLDDLHWFDRDSEAFVRALLERLDRRISVFATYRPEYDSGWMPSLSVDEIRLEPLGAEAMRELVGRLLGDDPQLTDLAGEVAGRAGGNPFFAEELVRTLDESGKLTGTRGHYRAAQADFEIEVPDTVHAVLAARIDRLGERSKQVLQTASVLGRSFRADVVRAAARLESGQLDAAMSDLVERRFVCETAVYPQREYSFEHPLTHEVAGSTLLSTRRQELHRAAAEAIEACEPGRLGELAALLAEHWELAGDWRDAAEWHYRAARWTGLANVGDAMRHWTRIRELIPADVDDDKALRSRVRACREVLAMGSRVGMDAAELVPVRDEARAGARRLDDSAGLSAIETSYALSLALEGNLRRATETLDEARRLAEQGDEIESLVDFAVTSGYVYGWCGHAVEQIAVCDFGFERLAATEIAVDRAVSAWLHSIRAEGLMDTGRLEEARRSIERSLEWASNPRALEVRGFAVGTQARLTIILGRYDEAYELALQSRALGEECGSVGVLGTSSAYASLALVEGGRSRQAIAMLRPLIELLEGGRIVLFRNVARCQLSLALCEVGEYEEALAIARDACASSLETGALRYAMFSQRAIGRALGALGDHEAANRELDRADALVGELQARAFQPDIDLERARLARSRGNEEEAATWLRRAADRLREMGATERAEGLSGS